MTKTQTTTNAAAFMLNTSGHDGYQVERVVRGRIRLAVPAASLNAADFLRDRGVDATARLTGNGWVVAA